jgi:RNA polymerase sigma factor (sigma-70 family)
MTGKKGKDYSKRFYKSSGNSGGEEDRELWENVYRMALSSARRTSPEGVGIFSPEDIAQQTFVRIYEKRGRFDPKIAKLSTWIYAICRNVVRDCANAEGRRIDATSYSSGRDCPGRGVVDLESGLELVEPGQILRDCVSDLPERQREIVTGWMRGKTYEQISSELGFSKSTAHKGFVDALTALRGALERVAPEYFSSEAA